jgi:hypothetical protein
MLDYATGTQTDVTAVPPIQTVVITYQLEPL